MKRVTMAWWFKTPRPLPLSEARARLGDQWIEHDSEYKRDSISGPLTSKARARIFEIGLRGFVVNLTVEERDEEELEESIAEAKSKLFGEVLPLLDAREIAEAQPEG